MTIILSENQQKQKAYLPSITSIQSLIRAKHHVNYLTLDAQSHQYQ